MQNKDLEEWIRMMTTIWTKRAETLYITSQIKTSEANMKVRLMDGTTIEVIIDEIGD